MKLINIGFGNLVSAGRVVAVVSPDSAPVKRLVKEARERGMLIDASYGRSTRAVLIMDSDHVVLSALTPETVAGRAAGQPEGKPTEQTGIQEKQPPLPVALRSNPVAGQSRQHAQSHPLPVQNPLDFPNPHLSVTAS